MQVLHKLKPKTISALPQTCYHSANKQGSEQFGIPVALLLGALHPIQKAVDSILGWVIQTFHKLSPSGRAVAEVGKK
jgi:hypothetical protein